jgi:hypothetical protein
MGDEDLIIAAVHDYFDGWFDGDAARMENALHPEFVKRTSGPDQASTLGIITAAQMVEWTGHGEGKQLADRIGDRSIDVTILDVNVDIATVLVRSEPYHEYLHLVRTREGWKLANALWRNNRARPRHAAPTAD